MLMLNKYVNVDDITQGRVFLLKDMIIRWLTEQLYRQNGNNERILSSYI